MGYHPNMYIFSIPSIKANSSRYWHRLGWQVIRLHCDKINWVAYQQQGLSYVGVQPSSQWLCQAHCSSGLKPNVEIGPQGQHARLGANGIAIDAAADSPSAMRELAKHLQLEGVAVEERGGERAWPHNNWYLSFENNVCSPFSSSSYPRVTAPFNRQHIKNAMHQRKYPLLIIHIPPIPTIIVANLIHRIITPTPSRTPSPSLTLLITYSHFMQPRSKATLPTHKPPLPTAISPSATSPRNDKSPHYTRTSSQQKQFKKTSLSKHPNDSIRHQLRYSKVQTQQQLPSTQRKSRLDEVTSRDNNGSVYGSWTKLEESQSTVQRRRVSPPKDRQDSILREGWTSLDRTQRLDASRASRLSGANSVRRSSIEHKDEYYIYWKNKAHEYLQSNMKLMQQVKRLNQDNQDLKEQLQLAQKLSDHNASIHKQYPPIDEDKLFEQIRKNSIYYLAKIQTLQTELKRKNSVIVAYELKIGELTQRVAGDLQRMRLVERIASDLQTKTPETPKYWDESIRKEKKKRQEEKGRSAIGLLIK